MDVEQVKGPVMPIQRTKPVLEFTDITPDMKVRSSVGEAGEKLGGNACGGLRYGVVEVGAGRRRWGAWWW